MQSAGAVKVCSYFFLNLIIGVIKVFRKIKMSVFRPQVFKNCVAIVTGGGTGIGWGISYELLTLGAKVVIASRNEARLSSAAEQLRKHGEVSSFQCNIRDEAQVKNLISETLAKYGKLDFLVNNGGGQFLSPAASISPKGWNAVVGTNLTGTFFMMQEAYNQWFKDNGGAIVNITYDDLRGGPSASHSAAARAGVNNLTKSLAVEWARDRVRVNSVAPFPIESKTAAKNYSDTQNIFDGLRKHVPIGRIGRIDDVSSTVCFLLSPGASFITGTTIIIDGGYSLHAKQPWPLQDSKMAESQSWIPHPNHEEMAKTPSTPRRTSDEHIGNFFHKKDDK